MSAELAITPPTARLSQGSIVGDRYQIVDILSYGAMGIIYRARHRTLGIPLALKAMRAELASTDYYERFAEEARNAALLKSDHVARVFDFGRLASGELYLVMELLEGEDLATLLSSCGALPAETVIRLALQACDALGEAHAAGIVHRDLKPENLFLARLPSGDTRLKVLDFGVSKRISGPRRHATITGSVGSPSYMSPEQLRSQPDVDNRADIWALGVVLYELLAARPAFDGATVAEICTNVLTRRPTPLVEIRPSVGGLSRVVRRCLELDRAQRFQTMRELAHALAQVRSEARAEPPRKRRFRAVHCLAMLAALPVAAATGAVVQWGPRQSLELARERVAGASLAAAHTQRDAHLPLPRSARVWLAPAEPGERREPTAPDEAQTASAAVPVRVLYRPWRPPEPAPSAEVGTATHDVEVDSTEPSDPPVPESL
jgi:hypothetical protein